MANMSSSESADAFPPYAYFPGGPWPHPTRSPEGHSFGPPRVASSAAESPEWFARRLRRGIELFDAGYYWEAHEVWEELWHACGRIGTTADILRALIKLAAAGVKVREGQEHGVRTHARRAAELLRAARAAAGPHQLGLDLDRLTEHALDVATNPGRDAGPFDAKVAVVFPFRIALGEP
jgi:predicted metal-dependent hydrolase